MQGAVAADDVNEARERARQWAARFRGARVISELRGEGVELVLLKGAAFARRLYGRDEWRPSVDLDLLVGDAHRGVAERMLSRLGFEPYLLASDCYPGESPHADEWIRRQDGLSVDLHRSLPGVGASDAVLWAALQPHIVPLDVEGTSVPSLDDAGLCLVAALAAWQDGPTVPKAREDLRRALAGISAEAWEFAATLAAGVEAREAFAAGLLVGGGDAMIDRLGGDGDLSSRRLSWDAPHLARLSRVLRNTPSPAARLAIIARIAFPTPRALKASDVLARRGRWGLIRAYARRPVRLLGIARLEQGAWSASRRYPA